VGAETEIVIGDERFEALEPESPVTAGVERFVMSETRRRRLVIKEDELFMYTDARASSRPPRTRRWASTSVTRAFSRGSR